MSLFPLSVSTLARGATAVLTAASLLLAAERGAVAPSLPALELQPPEPPQELAGPATTAGSGWLLRSGGWYIRVDGAEIELPGLPRQEPPPPLPVEERGPVPFDDLIAHHAQEHGFDWRLIAALIFEESRFQPESRSSQGAVGLMQVRPIAAEQIGAQRFEAPADNIRAGVKYLRYLEDLFPAAQGEDRLNLALAAYNMGPAHVRDAQDLAEYYGFDPNRWRLSMDRIVPLLEDPEVHRFLPAGYAKGSDVVSYVERIRKRYAQYQRELAVVPAYPGNDPASSARVNKRG